MYKNMLKIKELLVDATFIMLVLFLSVSCSRSNNNTQGFSTAKNVIEIRERLFIGQVNEIYLNADDYLGKTIKLEGIFKQEQYGEEQYNYVVRYGPGCCGNDGYVGFEISWAESRMQAYPKENSWVEVIGELKVFKENGDSQYLYLDLSSLAVLDRRGIEFVNQ